MHTHTFLRLGTIVSIVTGITMCMSVSASVLQGQLSNGGALVTGLGDAVATPEVISFEQGSLHGAAQADFLLASETVKVNLLIGILCVLLGFLFHAILTARQEHTVHVTHVEHRQLAPHVHVETFGTNPKWFWVEMRL